MTKEEMRKVRENRMDTAISMQEPDRVPFCTEGQAGFICMAMTFLFTMPW